MDQIIINYRQQWLLENKKGSQQDDVFDLFDWDKESFTKVVETENDDEIRMKFVPKEELQKQKEEKNPYLMNEFFNKHLPMLKYNNLVSVTIDKLTNELTGFIKLTDDKEVKQILSREECLQKHFNFRTSYSRYQTISASLGGTGSRRRWD